MNPSHYCTVCAVWWNCLI